MLTERGGGKSKVGDRNQKVSETRELVRSLILFVPISDITLFGIQTPWSRAEISAGFQAWQNWLSSYLNTFLVLLWYLVPHISSTGIRPSQTSSTGECFAYALMSRK